MNHGLSKSRLLNWRQCPRRLWLRVHRPELEFVSDATNRVMRAGHDVGTVARELYPEGVLIETDTLGEALRATKEMLSPGNRPVIPLFEATFARNGVLVQADLLLPVGNGCRMVEVKSAAEFKPYYIEDAAIQYWVVAETVRIAQTEIAHIDRAFRYPGDGNYQGLFKHVPVDAEVFRLQGEVSNWVLGARATLNQRKEPDCPPGDQCHEPVECPFYEHCSEEDHTPEYPLSCIPRLHHSKRDELLARGITDVRDIPVDFPLTENQQRPFRVIRTGVPELNPQAAQQLAALPYPRYYLDFETIQMAVPIWKDTRPYQILPVQWSCHIETQPGKLDHLAFLADGVEDPRRDFANQLIAAIGEVGPIFVYSQSFEGSRLSELAADFPELAPGLKAVIDRLVDLKPLTEKSYCHPAMKGSWSIKAVLPTIDSNLDYAKMAIGDGGEAAGAWLEIFHPETPEERKQRLRENLAAYCALDTLAMVRVAKFLADAPR